MDVVAQRREELYRTFLDAKRDLPSLLDDPRRWYAFETTTFEPHITRALCRYANGGLLLHLLRKGTREPDPHGHPRDIVVELCEGRYSMTRGAITHGVLGPQSAPEIFSAGSFYTLLTSESHTIDVLSDRVLSVCYVAEKTLGALTQEQTTPLTKPQKLDHLARFRDYC